MRDSRAARLYAMPMSTQTSTQASPVRLPVLAAAVLLNGAFGSLYAWSVFVPALEGELSVSRGDISIVFSLAIATFMLGNILAAFLFGRIPAPTIPVIGAALALGGLYLSANGDFSMLLGGYGVMFGLAAGLSYNTALQAAQAALRSKPGLANGIVISAFAFGAMIAAALLAREIDDAGGQSTLWTMGVCVGGAALVAAAIMAAMRVALHRTPWKGMSQDDRRTLGICWLGMLLATFAGLIAIGHAAPIVAHFGGTMAMAALGATLIGLGNALGRLGAGAVSDLVSARSIAGLAHLTATIGFVIVLANPGATGALITVVVSGFAYGLASGAYPSALAILLGRESHARNFAILLTAWGLAGLAGPYLGGFFFDLTGDYRVALELGSIASVLGIINAMRLPRKSVPSEN